MHAICIPWSVAYCHAHGDDVLIITRRNSDALALNKAARAVLRAEGRLVGVCPENLIGVADVMESPKLAE